MPQAMVGPPSPRSSLYLRSRASQDFSALSEDATPSTDMGARDANPSESLERQPLLSNVNSAKYTATGQPKAEAVSNNVASRKKPTARRELSDGSRQRRARQRDRFSYVQYYIPILRWLPGYNLHLFFGDLAGALSLTCLVVPQAMSYATALARVDAVHGLFGACIPSFIYAVFGTCAQLSVAPEAALSLLIGQTIGNLSRHFPKGITETERTARVVALTSLICFQTGLITLALGLMRLGFLDSVLSRPLLRGFVSAVGLVILIEQLQPVLGLRDIGEVSSNSIAKLVHILSHIGNTHLLTFAISSITLLFLIAYRLCKPKLIQKHSWIKFIPEVLICVVVTTILSHKLGWSGTGVQIVGKISAGHVSFKFPLGHHKHTLSYVKDTIGTSAVIAIAGFIDSTVAGKENASRFNYALSPNRELVALGAANVFASFVNALPGYGSITRSRLNASAGARTPMSSLLCATFTLLTTYYLLSYLSYLPQCVLSSIILLVVFSILQETPHDVAFFLRLRTYSDLGLMAATFILTVMLSVEIGLLVSIALSLMLVVQQSSAMQVVVMGRQKSAGASGQNEWVTLTGRNEEGNEEVPGVLIARVRGPMTFSNAGMLKERLRRLERYGITPQHPSKQPLKDEAHVLVLHLGDVDQVDGSAIQVLLETIDTYIKRGTRVYIAHIGDAPYRMLERAGVHKLLDQVNFQPDIGSALKHEAESQRWQAVTMQS